MEDHKHNYEEKIEFIEYADRVTLKESEVCTVCKHVRQIVFSKLFDRFND